MRLDDYFKAILASKKHQWLETASWGNVGPSYRDRLLVTKLGASGDWKLEVESHSHVAIYTDDLSISIAWGMTKDEKVVENWLSTFPDSSGRSFFIDFFFNSTLVYRDVAVSVDGGRVDLPFPRHEKGQLVVPEPCVTFFRLLNAIQGVPDFDQYFGRAGFSTTPTIWPAR